MKHLRLVLALILCSSVAGTAQVPFIKEREHINLTNWTFIKGIHYNAQSYAFNTDKWNEVTVPHTYSLDAINDVGYYKGQAWYRTYFSISDEMKGERIYIRFEGVGQEANVFINEQPIGNHIGGYSAFCYEITDVVDWNNENLVAVQVSNAPNFKRIPVNDVLFNHYGGIYRPVQIFSTPRCNIKPDYYASSGVFVETKELDSDKANVETRFHLSNATPDKEAEINYIITDKEGEIVHQESQKIQLLLGDTVLINSFDIPDPTLWHGRKNPYLYNLTVELKHLETTDKVNQTFGLRSYTVDAEKGFFLNDEPYRLYGVAMHQEWKQHGPALIPEHHKQDMAMVDELGVTSLRLSHYQHSDITMQLADELGILVWAEIPFVHDYSGREGDNAKQQLTELIIQNYNHPSIYVWGIWNEVRAWEHPDEPCVGLTKELVEQSHKLDATRLTASASDRGNQSNMGSITDLQAWNKYYGWYYDEYEDMATWLDDARREYPDLELGISEYGIGGNIYQQDTAKLEKPVGNYFPEPEQSMYHELTWKIIKDRPFIWSTYIWNMFDFSVAGWNRGGIPNLNHKGLVTFDREVKKDAFYFYKANWSDEPVLYIAERRNDMRTEATNVVKVYTNQPKVTLYVNGNKQASGKLVSDINIIRFDGIELKKGVNHIKVTTPAGDYVDEVVWKLE